MRNKILELIYNRLETPTLNSAFYNSTPFGVDYYNGNQILDFRFKFPDGSPDIIVFQKRISDNRSIFNLFCKIKYETIVKCEPMVFTLTPLEQDALLETVKTHDKRHLELKYDAEYAVMENKINQRLEK